MLNWSRGSNVAAVSREVPMTKELIINIKENQGKDLFLLEHKWDMSLILVYLFRAQYHRSGS